MKLQVIGSQCPKLINKMLQVAKIDCHNFEAVGRLVAQNIGMIYCTLKDGDSVTLCFTAPKYCNEYWKKMQGN
jgi:hypothetical protein